MTVLDVTRIVNVKAQYINDKRQPPQGEGTSDSALSQSEINYKELSIIMLIDKSRFV